jgi:carbon monoxide dehydrogenase subunit G
MKVGGTFRLAAPREAVFEAICDPATLLAIIPGCDAIERVGPDEYAGRLTLRLPGMVGSYRTHVRLVDATAPGHAGLDARVEGALGSIEGRGDFTLTAAAGGTVLAYRGNGVVDGPLARLDSRFAESLAESLISQGLRALDRRLAGVSPSDAQGVRHEPIMEVSE